MMDLRQWITVGAGLGFPGLGVVIYLWLQAAKGVAWLVERRDRRLQDERAMLLQVYGVLQAETQRATALNASTLAELERMRQARDQVNDVLGSTVEAAVAARLLVHELQDSAGVPRTVFPPLPQVPPRGGPALPAVPIASTVASAAKAACP